MKEDVLNKLDRKIQLDS